MKLLTLACRIRLRHILVCLICLFLLCMIAFLSTNNTLFQLSNSFKQYRRRSTLSLSGTSSSEYEDGTNILDFEGFNNNNTNDSRHMIVPNIVHLIYINKTELRFH